MRTMAELSREDKENLSQGIVPYPNIPCYLVFEDKYEADRVIRLLERLLEEEGKVNVRSE